MDGKASPQLAGPNTKSCPTWHRSGSVAEFAFTVLGTPKPKGRPVTVRNRYTGKVNTFTPDKTVTWEQTVGAQARQALAWLEKNQPGELVGTVPFAGRIAAEVRFYLRRPKSSPKRVTHPFGGGDVDNLVKCIFDALQNVRVIGDDKTVTDMTVSKRFADADHPEGVQVTLTGWLDPE